MHGTTLALRAFSALVLFSLACSSPPGREPEPSDVVAADESSGDESATASASAFPVDVACATISADPGWTCEEDTSMRGREGGLCPSGAPMVQNPGVYAFPEAPVDPRTVPDGVHVTDSELGTCVVRAGTGSARPGPTDRVTVHYLGWSSGDGVFDASVNRQTAISFGLNQVIAGWTEGVQLMVEGEVRRFFIPEHLAYQGRPGRPGGMLLFDVELLAINAEE